MRKLTSKFFGVLVASGKPLASVKKPWKLTCPGGFGVGWARRKDGVRARTASSSVSGACAVIDVRVVLIVRSWSFGLAARSFMAFSGREAWFRLQIGRAA